MTGFEWDGMGIKGNNADKNQKCECHRLNHL